MLISSPSWPSPQSWPDEDDYSSASRASSPAHGHWISERATDAGDGKRLGEKPVVVELVATTAVVEFATKAEQRGLVIAAVRNSGHRAVPSEVETNV